MYVLNKLFLATSRPSIVLPKKDKCQSWLTILRRHRHPFDKICYEIRAERGKQFQYSLYQKLNNRSTTIEDRVLKEGVLPLHPGWGRARNHLWSDRPRQVGPLIRPSQNEVTSDQTSMRSKIIVRSKCARSRLWSDEFQTEVTPDQTSSRPLSRRDDFEHEQISQYRYNIFISSIILSILYSTNKKTNPESIVNESKSKKKWSKKLLSMPFFMLLTEKMNLDSSA